MAYWCWLPHSPDESNYDLRARSLPALCSSRFAHGSRPSIHWTLADATCFSFFCLTQIKDLEVLLQVTCLFGNTPPCHFCKHATWNHLARHHVTFTCQVSNPCHHLWLNALSGGWDQHTSPLLLPKTCADFESLALHFGNFVGSELSLLCDINPSEATDIFFEI